MRLLDKENILLDLTDLGFDQNQLATMEHLITRPNGIILVTGPTGSGKTTTLYACLNKVNQPDVNILTVEDPVEYELKGIGQVHVQPKIGLTFASGLRSFLRQDPDIIMVGEIRDHETAEIAIHASLTGHLVLSTLHTNDAAGAVTRLVEMGVQPFHISSSLMAVLAQRLVRQLCPKCRSPTSRATRTCARSASTRPRLSAPPRDSIPPAAAPQATRAPDEHAGRRGARCSKARRRGQRPVFYKPVGCEACAQTGYRGRIGIYELLVISDAVRKEILNNSDSNAITRAGMRGRHANLASGRRAPGPARASPASKKCSPPPKPATWSNDAWLSTRGAASTQPARRSRASTTPTAPRRCASPCAARACWSRSSRKRRRRARARRATSTSSALFARVSLTDLALTTRQMATLLKAGIPLVEALDALIEQIEKEELRNALTNTRDKVNEGIAFNDALRAHPKIFGELYTNMVAAGEASGNLDQVLARLADVLESQARIKGKVSSALAYPVVMLVITSLMVAVMMTLVVPKVTRHLRGLRADAALVHAPVDVRQLDVHRLLVPADRGHRRHRLQRSDAGSRSPAGRKQWDIFMLTAPIFGALTTKVACARFARTLATLLHERRAGAVGARDHAQRAREHRADARRRRGARGHPRGRVHRQAAGREQALSAHRHAHDRHRRALGRARGDARERGRRLRRSGRRAGADHDQPARAAS